MRKDGQSGEEEEEAKPATEERRLCVSSRWKS